MTPERVLSQLYARTMVIDFGKPDPLLVSQVGATTVRATTRRPQFPEIANAVDVEHITARGRQSRSFRTGDPKVDAAGALAGMTQRAWQAICVSLQTGDGSRAAVYARLKKIAEKKLGTKGWPKKLQRKHLPGRPAPCPWYYLDLVELAILELEQPGVYASTSTKIEFAGVSRATWYASLRKPSDQLSHVLWSWYYEGLGHIENRLKRARGSRAQ